MRRCHYYTRTPPVPACWPGHTDSHPIMHLDTDQTLLHHLVAADGNNDVMARDMTPPAAFVMAAIMVVMTLVVVMAMCVCHKKRATHKEPGEPMLQEVIPVDDGKPATTNVMTASPIEDTDVLLTVVDSRNSRQSNGSVIMGKEVVDNGRPKSHDQRALPEIPAGPLSNGVMQTDDEDDEEGHYDIISRHRAMAASRSAASVSTTSTPPARDLNLYEKVGTGNDGVTPDRVGVGNRGKYSPALGNMNPYATVDGIGSADYAHIDGQGKRRGGGGTQKNAGLNRVKAHGDAHSGASTDTLNESYASIPPPPVPDKNFCNPDSAASSLNPNALSSVSPQNSPGLPLRNSMVLTSSDDIGRLTTVPSVATGGALDGGPVMEINAEPGESTTGKREPPYSSVTARESLANLRQRQAIERQQLQPLPHDATYESVNYDQITSPAVANLNTMTSDRNSLTSDLYAEIASGSGENSTRSSVYAKVGDVSGIVQETPAPTPPPMDFLKHLPNESAKKMYEGMRSDERFLLSYSWDKNIVWQGNKNLIGLLFGAGISENDDELPDPGYSIIRRARPTSAYSAMHTPQHPQSPDEEDSEGQPVYAVVDKSRRNRNTVCVSTDVNRNLDLQNGDDSVDLLYAQVNKPRRVPTNLDFPQTLSPAAYVGTGARPKVRNGGAVTNNNPSMAAGTSGGNQVPTTSCSSDIDPAYQTIPSDVNNAGAGSDPAYEDIVQHNQMTERNSSDFDPNYECVRTESMTQMMGRLSSPGVATEISASDMTNHPHGLVHINDHHVDATFWQRQEHVYQEIGSTQHTQLDHSIADRTIHNMQRTQLDSLADRTLHNTQRTQLDHCMADHTLHQISTDL